MKIFKALGIAALALATYLPATANASFFFNGNYPDVKWKTFETEHFVFHYYEQTAKDHPNTTAYTARRAAKYAEIMYPKVCEQFNHFLKEKVHVVVRDQEDISNGFAVYTEDWITIWATPLYYRLRGRMDWIPDVMTHEFAHVVSLKANEVRGVGMSFGASAGGIEEDGRNDFAYAAAIPFGEGNSAPFWWTEGGAEYWTHNVGYNHWGSSRDMLLRVSMLDPDATLTLDQLGVRGDKTGMDGERGYNHGYSIGLYLAEKYGQETYSKFAEASKAKYRFDWENVIKEVLGITPEQMWQGWVQWNRDKYAKVVSELEKQGIHEGVEANWTEPQWRTKDEKKAKAWKDLTPRERRYKREKLGLGNYYAEVSPDGNAFATVDTRTGRLKITFANPDELPAFTGKWLEPDKKPEDGKDAKPAATPTGMRGFQADGEGKELTDKERLDRIATWTIPGVGDSDFGFSPDGTKIVVNMAKAPACLGSFEFDGYEWDDLVVIDLTKALEIAAKKKEGKKVEIDFGCFEQRSYMKQITNELRATQPSWSPDGKSIAFLKYNDGTYNIAKISPEGGEVTYLTKFEDGTQIGEPRWSPDSRKLTFYMYRQDQQDIWEMNADGTDLHPLTWDKYEDKDSVYVDNDTILYATDVTGIFNVYKLHIPSGKVTQLTNVVGGAFSPALTKDGNLLYAGFTAYGHQNFGLKKSDFYNKEVEPYKLPGEKAVASNLGTSEDLPPIPQTRPYSAIKDMQPPVIYPIGRYDNQNVQAGGELIWWDYAGKHAIIADVLMGQSQDYIFRYINDMWYPTLGLIWARFERSRELGFQYTEEGQVGEIKLRQLVDYYLATANMAIGPRHDVSATLSTFSFDSGFGEDAANLRTALPWEAGEKGFLSTYEASFNMNYRTVDPSRGGGTFDINPRGAREINTSLSFNFTDITDGDVDDGERLSSYTASSFQIAYAEYWAVPWLEYLQHTLQFSTQFGYVNRNVQFNGEFFAGGKHPYSSFNQINVNTEFAGYEPFSVTGETMLMSSLAYRMPLYRDFDKKIGPFYFDSLYLQFFGTAGNLWSFRPNPSELDDGSLGISPLEASGNIRELPIVGLFSEDKSNKLENDDTVPGDPNSSYADIPIEGMGKRRYGSENPDMFARAFPVAYKNGNRLLTDVGAELRVRAYAYNYNPWFSFFRLAYGFQDTAGVGDQNGDRIFRDLPPNDDPVGEIEKAGFRYYIGIGTGW